MASMLDVLSDLKLKKQLLDPPVVDLAYRRKLADGKEPRKSWEKKFALASEPPVSLTEHEFHYFGLAGPQISQEEANSHVGKVRQTELHDLCNSDLWVATSGDKALFELVLRGANLPVVETLGVLSKSLRSGFEIQMHTKQDLKSFLIEQQLPIFCKPIDGMFGIGTFIVDALDGEKIFLRGRPSETLDDFYSYITKFSRTGYLFQRVIRQTISLTQLIGAGVATIRFLIFTTPHPRIVSAVLRGAPASSICDNFWQPGSLLASIDVNTGQIANALLNEDSVISSISRVPSTSHRIEGVRIEQWEEAVKLVLQAACLFPMVRTQSWDIALSEDGPIAVEYNWGGDLNIHQLANRRGIYDETYKDHVLFCQA